MLQPSTIKRRLKTLLSEFKRARQIWSELNDDGLEIANSLMNIKLQERKVDYSIYWKNDLDNLPDLEENYETKNLNENYKNLSQSLRQIFEKMGIQYTKMKIQILQMESLLEESCESLGEEFTYDTPLYLTCPLETFVNKSGNILNMYTQELNLKKSIISSIEIINERDKIMVMLSSWLNQPLINIEIIKEFEEVCEIEIDYEESL
ncbi:hypothetical protein RhiirA5_497941 [Rhizophagus irregularis]|uniref:Cyclin-dependent kinase 2-interacting protein n=5 Tax=Rhizophagus irregularis TaxID=588596 RepID=A0A2I1GPN8_9GLOM|nr:hypothetical protein GLOIN_2v1777609 [Rhizophagus irregularis DAOM 181602=DAOM 197198]PKC11122.1 hypothetical protein RhiirA5_497941 [Rhizophagus irregularis]PKC69231.1 hypothetical protein RhiirA1_533597 [Rhizophagus irregularis]PKY12638.1 hypothetical protein RhiirB3_518160 [Rhizophagus irregularis]PKY48603.1 hypothetical protein RhiirA4_544725 [Rhizophagus irregularis]POG69024.1 hypothetical protein GLOIN_2v1777609 [Rhizophagus irregularis DAOM 181602=DAOM 197198]|eukprot:XP_025175890.1 hypothetical protein GLOIN_2v1777609 [Rhizophagus irregularis DAOM 181602=DAOM 197198]